MDSRVRTLASLHDRQSILNRLGNVTETDVAIWGRMTVHEMLCHLSDAYSLALGERAASPATTLLQRTLVKWVALHSPFPWPHGVPTRPEMEQGVGGTPPDDFQRDHARLSAIIPRFAESPDLASTLHPIFGSMRHGDWLRWGYVHADHHLRQFGR